MTLTSAARAPLPARASRLARFDRHAQLGVALTIIAALVYWASNRSYDAGRGDFFYLADAFLHGRTWLDLRPGFQDVIPVDGNELVRVYAQIDAGLRDRGIKMGKNDLWIAATVTVSEAYLLTTDKDFLPLFETGLRGERIDPTAP